MPSLIEAFEQHLRVERRRGALTIARYSSIVYEFLQHLVSSPETSGLRLADITRLHCRGYLRSPGRTATEEPSRSVWNQRLSALRAWSRFLIDQETIVKDPTEHIERHKIASKEVIPLSLDEFRELVAAAERSSPIFRSRNVAIVQVILNTGLRVRELVSLDVDQVQWDAYLFEDVRTKGDKSLTPKFPRLVAEVLQRYLADRGTQRPVSTGALFLSKRGTRLSVRAVEELVRELGRAAGIKRSVTPHLLRHSCATILYELGTRLNVVQMILGHASQTTTERYLHAWAGADRAAIDALGEAVEHALRLRSELRHVAA